MKLLKLEFLKCRRRKIVLVCAAVLAVELIWMGAFFTRQDAEDLKWGWMLLLYNLSMVDAIILPLSVATLASRNCELEHKGSTWKLLETMTSPGSLYAAKLCWGALVLAALLMIRSGLFLGVGIAQGFQGPVPWGRFGVFTLISWAVSMMVYALQQGLSLRFLNQAAALVCGIAGSFLGILSMLFPPALTRCVPWGYYGLLTLVGMDWNPATRVTAFHWQWPELQKCRRSPVWLAFVLLPVFPAILGTGNYLGNIEVLDDAWYSLWSQHTLFSSIFFLPALLGVFCAWQWRLEHTAHNWNSFLTAPVPAADLYAAKLVLAAGISLLAQVCIGVLFLISGKIVGISSPLPPELPDWILCGTLGAFRSARYNFFSVW